jgi:hypothetical protein
VGSEKNELMRLIPGALSLMLFCSACAGSGEKSDSDPVPRLLDSKLKVPEPGSDEQDSQSVAAFLDAWHKAAALADGEGYFGRIAEDGVFLGTDPNERWIKADFQAAFASYFQDKESAWIYVPGRRAIAIEGQHAWFDEDLVSASYGKVRGSGVLRRKGGTWEVVQYNLHFTVPNGAAEAVLEAIRAYESQ